MRLTKVMCTLGPASAERVPDLIESGMDVARINLAHGDEETRNRLLASVRDAAERAGRPVGVMADLSGPKVRLGEVDRQVVLEPGARFELRASGPGDATGAATNHPQLAADLEVGDRVLLADGAVELRVVDEDSEVVGTEVVRGGLVRSRAGVNVPSERLSVPAISPKDEADLRWAVEAGVDMVAQSFVRHAYDVRVLAGMLGDPRPVLVAKLETKPAVEEAAEVVEAADAVIVARGDLGVEAPLEEIPVLQKRLVGLANDAARPVIVATQMLESMTASPRPTRAEAQDVAQAAFDGSDAILLSAETAIGRYPVEAARTAAAILETAETSGADFLPRDREPGALDLEELPLARAAAVLARRGAASAVACFTRTGLTARLLSACRPGVPIHAFSPDPAAVGRMTSFHGVVPRRCDAPKDTDAMIAMMDRALTEAGVSGDVVMVASSPAGQTHANLLKVHHL
ncbi:MAG TPA: pyruvate kinase [Actinomycetota bacterium]|nr:pyruvate kinase [Actinomycetota bacterium]